MQRTLKLVSAAAALALGAGALAQDQPLNVYQMPAPQFNAAMYNPWFVMKPIVESGLNDAPRGDAVSEPRAPVATTAPPSARSVVPQKLAASYPQPARREAERVFRELLAGYAKIEQQFGIPKHDVAGSAAAFLAGSYMAYHNVDFPDGHFPPLVEQMRAITGGNAEFAKASNAQKQEMYEQMAILGMFMATTQVALKQQPNAQIEANMKQAAKGYLEQFLKTDAERVQITAQGLVLK